MPLQSNDAIQYFKRFEFFIKANDKAALNKSSSLSSCGQEAFSLIETLLAPADITADDVTDEQIKTSVLAHFQPKTIPHYERHQLHSMLQHPGECAADYVQRLQQQANRCGFDELKDDLILSQFIFGLQQQSTGTRLLATANLTLDAAIQEVLLQELIAVASASSESTISALRTESKSCVSRSLQLQGKSCKPQSHVSEFRSSAACHSCARTGHRRSQCKFRDATCHKCGRKGHISAACRSTTSGANAIYQQSRDVTNDTVKSTTQVDLQLDSCKDNLWHENCMLFDKPIEFLVDTGSQVTLHDSTCSSS